MNDYLRFSEAALRVLRNIKNRDSIGILKEKSIHATLKNYFEQDEAKLEVKLGSFVADIFDESYGVIEIQTASFQSLKSKLEYFLQYYNVTLVHPISSQKHIIRLDKDSYEIIGKKRKSPKKGIPHAIFPELYKIRDTLLSPNLKIKIVMMNSTEYRLANAKIKRGKVCDEKFDIVPNELLYELDLTCAEDYLKLLPEGLPEEFTVNDVKKVLETSDVQLIQCMLLVMRHVGVIETVGKCRRMNVYRVKC